MLDLVDHHPSLYVSASDTFFLFSTMIPNVLPFLERLLLLAWLIHSGLMCLDCVQHLLHLSHIQYIPSRSHDVISTFAYVSKP